jgi:hypothetical protein
LEIGGERMFILETQHLDGDFPADQFTAQITEEGGDPAEGQIAGHQSHAQREKMGIVLNHRP